MTNTLLWRTMVLVELGPLLEGHPMIKYLLFVVMVLLPIKTAAAEKMLLQNLPIFAVTVPDEPPLHGKYEILPTSFALPPAFTLARDVTIGDKIVHFGRTPGGAGATIPLGRK